MATRFKYTATRGWKKRVPCLRFGDQGEMLRLISTRERKETQDPKSIDCAFDYLGLI